MKNIFKQGFTVVELIVVIVVIAILVSLTAIGYSAMRDKTYDETVSADLQSIAAAFDAYKSAEGVYPGTLSELREMSSKVPEASYTISKDSYDTESDKIISDGKAENLVICSINKMKYGMAAVSKSGHVITLKSENASDSSKNGVVVIQDDDYEWVKGIKGMCYKMLDMSKFYMAGYIGAANYSRDVSNTDLSAGWGNWRSGGMDQLGF